MSVIARTDYGEVLGVSKTTALNVDYSAFYGIPYAKPPIGDLRFKNPQPPEKWDGIYDTTKEKLGCIGRDSHLKKIIGMEDCLHLNIYTKNLMPKKSFPVMVYIFGGAFQTGSTTTELYGPDYLLMADVIVVMLNFRFGPLGFMSFKDESLGVPGNVYLKDQLMALEFVKNNITNFGGDSNNITLFGHSSGAVSVNLLCSNEKAKGLFNRAIIMSGSILTDEFHTSENQNWALRLARKLGYSGSEKDKDVLEFLQVADPVRMVEEQNNLFSPEESKRNSFVFKPHLEPYVNEETFISKHPIEMSRTAWGNDIDVIIGCVSDEGLQQLTYMKRNPEMITKLNLADMIPNELNFSENEAELRTEFANKLSQLYFPASDPNDIESEETRKGFCQLISDKTFYHSLSRLIRSRKNSNGKGKTFFYRFSFDSPTMNLFRVQRNRPNVRGVDHADILSYIFKHNYDSMCSKESKEFAVIQNIISLFTSFATTGNPNDNVTGLKMTNEFHWHEVQSKNQPFKCLNIDEFTEFIENPDSDRLTLWDNMYIETNTPPC